MGDGVRVLEFAAIDQPQRVDEEKKQVLDVAVLRSHSGNGYDYEPGALADAARVFEGAKVYLNHREGSKPHNVQTYVGRLNDLRVNGDTVRAATLDVVNEQHWPLIRNIATKDPKGMGLSIDARAKFSKDRKRVVGIVSGHSVDFVSSPGTTSGVFEEQTVETEITEEQKKEILKPVQEQLAASEKRNARLRQVIESGKRLSAVELKAVERLDDEDVKTFLEEIVEEEEPVVEERRRPRSRTPGGATMDKASLTAAWRG